MSLVGVPSTESHHNYIPTSLRLRTSARASKTRKLLTTSARRYFSKPWMIGIIGLLISFLPNSPKIISVGNSKLFFFFFFFKPPKSPNWVWCLWKRLIYLLYYLLSASTFALRGILPYTGLSPVAAKLYSLEMMHPPHSWSNYKILWASRQPPSWSARIMSSSRSLPSTKRGKSSRLVMTKGFSLVNGGRRSSSMPWSIPSSAWTVSRRMSITFTKMM